MSKPLAVKKGLKITERRQAIFEARVVRYALINKIVFGRLGHLTSDPVLKAHVQLAANELLSAMTKYVPGFQPATHGRPDVWSEPKMLLFWYDYMQVRPEVTSDEQALRVLAQVPLWQCELESGRTKRAKRDSKAELRTLQRLLTSTKQLPTVKFIYTQSDIWPIDFLIFRAQRAFSTRAIELYETEKFDHPLRQLDWSKHQKETAQLEEAFYANKPHIVSP